MVESVGSIRPVLTVRQRMNPSAEVRDIILRTFTVGYHDFLVETLIHSLFRSSTFFLATSSDAGQPCLCYIYHL